MPRTNAEIHTNPYASHKIHTLLLVALFTNLDFLRCGNTREAGHAHTPKKTPSHSFTKINYN